VPRVRKMERRDIGAVLEIQAACPEIAQWSAGDYERAAAGEIACWVVDDDLGVSGFLVARELISEAEILNLAVRTDIRRRGIGSELIAEAIDWSGGLGAEKVFLEVRESNEKAIRFYERHGFVAAGRRPGYYAAPVEDALVLTLPSQQGPGQSR